MSQTPPKITADGHLSWKKVAILVVAGLGSFVLAAVMQGRWQTGAEDADLAAAPRQRASPVSPLQAPATQAFVDPAAARLEVAMGSPSLRMNKMVVRDPFGPLAPELVPVPEAVPPPPPAAAKTRKRLSAPIVAEPAPPPAPTAPPLPFTAVGSIQGKKIGSGQQQAFIQQGDALTIIQKGDTVAGNYRVDDITPDRVVFTYLPLGQKQSLLLLDNPR